MIILYSVEKEINSNGHVKSKENNYSLYPPRTFRSKEPWTKTPDEVMHRRLQAAMSDSSIKLEVIGYSQRERFGIEDVMEEALKFKGQIAIVTFEGYSGRVDFSKLKPETSHGLDKSSRVVYADDCRHRYISPTLGVGEGGEVDIGVDDYDDTLFLVFDTDPKVTQGILRRIGGKSKVWCLYDADDDSQHAPRFVNWARWLGPRDDFVAIMPDYRPTALSNELAYFANR